MSNQIEKNIGSFSFESYGVRLRIESNDPELLSDAREIAQQALHHHFRITEPVEEVLVFRLNLEADQYVLYKNGELFTGGPIKAHFLKFFDGVMRLNIAEQAVDCVFVHAGAVGWKGKGIVIPGQSYSGKTSLVYEFIRRGAVYYSDEYAIFDKNGLLHPFPRKLAVRSRPRGIEDVNTSYFSPEELGGSAGDKPLPVNYLLLTKFEDGSIWEPEAISPGNAIIEMLSQTIPIRHNPEFALEILKKVTANAIILKGRRPDAVEFSEMILEFVDNKAF